MKKYLFSILKTTSVFILSFWLAIWSLFVFAITYPTVPPSWETVSGVFYDILKKIETNLISVSGSVNTISINTQNIITRTEYSKTCNDFASKWWSSKDMCLQDWRWHLVQSSTWIANNELKNAILNWADIKIKWLWSSAAPTNHSNWMCSIAFINNNYAYCQRIPHYWWSVEDNNPDSINYWFNASSPLPHNTWWNLSVSLIRSDWKWRWISIVPNNNISEDRTKIVARSISFYTLEWYIRY